MNHSCRAPALLILLVLLAPISCRDNPLEPQDSANGQVVAGLVAEGFEVSSFNPCGLNERWWVAQAPPSLNRAYSRLATQPYELVYLTARGIRSRLGHYGHLGLYDREFRIQEILEIRKRIGDECPIQTHAG